MKVKRYVMKCYEGIAEMENGDHWICNKNTWKIKPKELLVPPLSHGVINNLEWELTWKYKRWND